MKRTLVAAVLTLGGLMASTGCHGAGHGRLGYRPFAHHGSSHHGCGPCQIGCRPGPIGWQRGGTHYQGGLSHHADYRYQQAGSGVVAPQVAYPYYTTRGPRDFLMDNPSTIGR